MRILRLMIATTGLALLVPATGLAQSTDELAAMSPEQRREHVQGLSETEREALREQRRAQWDAMSEDERAAARDDLPRVIRSGSGVLGHRAAPLQRCPYPRVCRPGVQVRHDNPA